MSRRRHTINKVIDKDRLYRDCPYPYIRIGYKANYLWPSLHVWCKAKFGIDGYNWRGTIFYFANEGFLLEFCDVWMHEDEIYDIEEF